MAKRNLIEIIDDVETVALRLRNSISFVQCTTGTELVIGEINPELWASVLALIEEEAKRNVTLINELLAAFKAETPAEKTDAQ